jgi:hypothetical protein
LKESLVPELALESIWNDGVDIACGGSPRVLVDAIISSSSLPSRTQIQALSSSSAPDSEFASDEIEALEWQITEGASYDLLTWLVLWRDWTEPPKASFLGFDETEQHAAAQEWDGSIEEDEYYWPTAENDSTRVWEAAEEEQGVNDWGRGGMDPPMSTWGTDLPGANLADSWWAWGDGDSTKS